MRALSVLAIVLVGVSLAAPAYSASCGTTVGSACWCKQGDNYVIKLPYASGSATKITVTTPGKPAVSTTAGVGGRAEGCPSAATTAVTFTATGTNCTTNMGSYTANGLGAGNNPPTGQCARCP